MASTNPVPLTAVLVGGTGNGKSTTGNTLLGALDREVFKTSRRQTVEHPQLQHATVPWDGREVTIIDTPGWFDEGFSQAQAEEKFRDLARRSDHGIDAFIFMVRYGRFDDHALRAYRAFKKMFGEQARSHTLLLFTQAFRQDGASTEEYTTEGIRDETFNLVRRHPQSAQREVFNDLGGADRILAVGSLAPERRHRDREGVLRAVAALAEGNGHPYDRAAFGEVRKKRADVCARVQALRPGPMKDWLHRMFTGLNRGDMADEVLASAVAAAHEESLALQQRLAEETGQEERERAALQKQLDEALAAAQEESLAMQQLLAEKAGQEERVQAALQKQLDEAEARVRREEAESLAWQERLSAAASQHERERAELQRRVEEATTRVRSWEVAGRMQGICTGVAAGALLVLAVLAVLLMGLVSVAAIAQERWVLTAALQMLRDLIEAAVSVPEERAFAMPRLCPGNHSWTQ